eukprot:scaffold49027_cov20-Tisochrysis_lutea.AAC.1
MACRSKRGTSLTTALFVAASTSTTSARSSLYRPVRTRTQVPRAAERQAGRAEGRGCLESHLSMGRGACTHSILSMLTRARCQLMCAWFPSWKD